MKTQHSAHLQQLYTEIISVSNSFKKSGKLMVLIKKSTDGCNTVELHIYYIQSMCTYIQTLILTSIYSKYKIFDICMLYWLYLQWITIKWGQKPGRKRTISMVVRRNKQEHNCWAETLINKLCLNMSNNSAETGSDHSLLLKHQIK